MQAETNSGQERWRTRREIAPFGLAEDKVSEIINTATHAVVAWTTKTHEPVQAVMVYTVIDDLITVTSTTNRAKYHAWKRNPAASFCITEPAKMGRQVTLRGRIEIIKSDDLLRRFTEAFLTRAFGKPPTPEVLAAELATFAAPDRHMMQLHVDKVLSHDLPALLKAEQAALE